jgi:hypothetical protein
VNAAFNDIVSSFVILEGRWKFYRDTDYKIPYDGIFGPGLYRWVEDFGIKNDDMSSLRPV